MGPDHSPLSKRHGATSVAEFRGKGYLPEALVNYLALVGWSPRGAAGGRSAARRDRVHSPIDELARRFSLDAVGLSAGVFDEEKLAWVNRHYLKTAERRPVRRAVASSFCGWRRGRAAGCRRLALPGFRPADCDRRGRSSRSGARRGSPFCSTSIRTAALADEGMRAEMSTDGARAVVRSFASAAAAQAPRLDRERFRAIANEVKASTGQKGKALFHPIRIALTAKPDGPELDLAVPAIDRGAELPPSAGLPTILGCRERAAAFSTALERP